MNGHGLTGDASTPKLAVIIPAMNEEQALPLLIPDIPAEIDYVIVVDNGSTDRTTKVVKELGAELVSVAIPGYGRACLAGIARAEELKCEIIIFMDGDRSDYPQQMSRLIEPIRQGHADIVIGSRLLGHRQKGALTPQQYYGNRLACRLIELFWRHRYTDLGPFRAIRMGSLRKLDMRELTFGWTVEMQVKALQFRLAIMEVPVDYRARIGVSKISGTVRGVILAGFYILKVIFRSAIWRR